jgi:hypothetical protein
MLLNSTERYERAAPCFLRLESMSANQPLRLHLDVKLELAVDARLGSAPRKDQSQACRRPV